MFGGGENKIIFTIIVKHNYFNTLDVFSGHHVTNLVNFTMQPMQLTPKAFRWREAIASLKTILPLNSCISSTCVYVNRTKGRL